MNIPEGFVLVPVEPTGNQLFAGRKANGVYQIYCDMVSAALPVELPAYDEAKERELFESQKFDKVPAYRKPNGEYKDFMDEEQWKGWKSCAKSRSRSAE